MPTDMTMKNSAGDTMMMNYLVTGANGPLGQAIAKFLLANGHKVLVTSRATSDRYDGLGVSVQHLAGIDLLDVAGLERLKSACGSFFTGPFHIINCTGHYEGQEDYHKTTVDESFKIFASNYLAVQNTATTLIPLQIERGGGHFIAFSCNSVLYNYPQMAPFTASKAALESLTKSLANEYFGMGLVTTAFRLATLHTEHELQVKPYGDHKNWLQLDEVAQFLSAYTAQPIGLHSGNVMNLFHYSDTFFSKSYFERIRR